MELSYFVRKKRTADAVKQILNNINGDNYVNWFFRTQKTNSRYDNFQIHFTSVRASTAYITIHNTTYEIYTFQIITDNNLASSE